MLKVKTRVVRLGDLQLLKKNARFMTDAQYSRLKDNIKRDGCLTSAPLVFDIGGKLEVLSGNHRVRAALDAGVEKAAVIEILTPLTDEQKIAIQLSHNAIAGDDDPNVLRELYEGLGFQFQEYSGLTDDAFDLDDLDMTVLSVGQPFYEEIVVSFLPEDAKIFTDFLAQVEKKKTDSKRLVGHYKDFNTLFDTLVDVKEHAGVHNAAVALRMMVELAAERLEDLAEQARAAEKKDKGKNNGNTGAETQAEASAGD